MKTYLILYRLQGSDSIKIERNKTLCETIRLHGGIPYLLRLPFVSDAACLVKIDTTIEDLKLSIADCFGEGKFVIFEVTSNYQVGFDDLDFEKNLEKFFSFIP